MNTEHAGATLVLSQIPEINAATSAAFREGARAALGDHVAALDIDLSSTRMVDSSGLGALIALQKTMHARGGTIRLLHPTPGVLQLLELTRLHRVFEVIRT